MFRLAMLWLTCLFVSRGDEIKMELLYQFISTFDS